eukprot:15466916-Alexandrium_andersonii.AAC.1
MHEPHRPAMPSKPKQHIGRARCTWPWSIAPQRAPKQRRQVALKSSARAVATPTRAHGQATPTTKAGYRRAPIRCAAPRWASRCVAVCGGVPPAALEQPPPRAQAMK